MEATPAAWRADMRLLEEMHRQLRAAVVVVPPRAWSLPPPDASVTRLRLITGVAAHDTYHAGRIQLLKKLYSRQPTGR